MNRIVIRWEGLDKQNPVSVEKERVQRRGIGSKQRNLREHVKHKTKNNSTKINYSNI